MRRRKRGSGRPPSARFLASISEFDYRHPAGFDTILDSCARLFAGKIVGVAWGTAVAIRRGQPGGPAARSLERVIRERWRKDGVGGAILTGGFSITRT